ncbi:MAG: 3' terminal RNA ribose 2'-O-methyltransferase Hen1 [Clostridiales bacterium]|jgi:SAM-dependent methyltransferase|nr:3' terminal RNA ribose 2'-O-methyltransferase Hen1 [Clostridiales bacterium]
MLLTITYTGENATDLGYLLYKNPSRPQTFELNYGKAHVFYPEATEMRTTAALLLDIDPIELALGKAGSAGGGGNGRGGGGNGRGGAGNGGGGGGNSGGGGLFDYVNDRPYVSSSFMSTAISKVYGTAMTGRADARQALSDSPLDLSATVAMLPCRGEQEKLRSVFEPLGYEVGYETFVSDEKFPDWGESEYVNLTIRGKVRLRDLLRHLYVLMPVFDRQKHYWIGADEVEKLLRAGEGWLPGHPEKAYIAGRYLYRRRSLANMAFERLAAANAADGEMLAADVQKTDEAPSEMPSENPGEKPDETPSETPGETPGEMPVPKPNLNMRRLGGVVAALKGCGAKRVIDIGCGDGNLLALLVKERQFTHIAGADVSCAALARAGEKLQLGRAGDAMRERVELFQGSLTYRDARFSGYDAACVVEVVEHLDIPRLAAFGRVLFEFARPPVVVLTTPNREYNAGYESLRGGELRHGDHRFEWTRAEFRDWAGQMARKFGYAVRFSEIGDADETRGAPTQMGVFSICG